MDGFIRDAYLEGLRRLNTLIPSSFTQSIESSFVTSLRYTPRRLSINETARACLMTRWGQIRLNVG